MWNSFFLYAREFIVLAKVFGTTLCIGETWGRIQKTNLQTAVLTVYLTLKTEFRRCGENTLLLFVMSNIICSTGHGLSFWLHNQFYFKWLNVKCSLAAGKKHTSNIWESHQTSYIAVYCHYTDYYACEKSEQMYHLNIQ